MKTNKTTIVITSEHEETFLNTLEDILNTAFTASQEIKILAALEVLNSSKLK